MPDCERGGVAAGAATTKQVAFSQDNLRQQQLEQAEQQIQVPRSRGSIASSSLSALGSGAPAKKRPKWMRGSHLASAVPGLMKAVPHSALKRRNSSAKWDTERIPSVRTWKQAVVGAIDGSWMRLYLAYKPSPETEGVSSQRDVDAFVNTQQHISLLAALLLEVVVGAVGERGDFTSYAGAVFSVSGLISAIFFFLSSLAAMVILVLMAQANTDSEARFFLLCFKRMSVRPFQLWIAGVIFLALSMNAFVVQQCLDPPVESPDTGTGGAALLELSMNESAIAESSHSLTRANRWTSYVVLQIALLLTFVFMSFSTVRVVKDLYLRKRAYKTLQLEMRTSGEGSASTARYHIVVPVADLLDALRMYVQMVGVEYVDEGRFMEYLFQRFKPMLSGGDEVFGDVLCQLSTLTRKRAQRLFARLVERKLQHDVDDNPLCDVGIDAILDPPENSI